MNSTVIEREVLDHFQKISPSEWASLFELLPIIEQYSNLEDNPVSLGRQPDVRNPKEWSKFDIERVTEMRFYELGLVTSLPMEYAREVNNLREQGVPYDRFSTFQLVKAITLIARANHHSNRISFDFEKGDIAELVRALKSRVNLIFDIGK